MDTIYYYTYNCPICGHEIEVGFYCEPHKYNTFTCDCGNDLAIDGVDNDNMTLDVHDVYDFVNSSDFGYVEM